jgi:two-component system, LuxR family, response regulator FixJ
LISINSRRSKPVLHLAPGTRMLMHSPAPLRVALVAQDEAVRDSLVLLLNASGCVAMPFGTGAAFLASAIARRAECLVLDEEIEHPGAWDMLAFLRQSGSDMRIALFTGRDAPDLARRAEQAGVARLLRAPLIAVGLVEFVARSREQHRREVGA